MHVNAFYNYVVPSQWRWVAKFKLKMRSLLLLVSLLTSVIVVVVRQSALHREAVRFETKTSRFRLDEQTTRTTSLPLQTSASSTTDNETSKHAPKDNGNNLTGILGDDSIRIWITNRTYLLGDNNLLLLAYNVDSPIGEPFRGGLLHVQTFSIHRCERSSNNGMLKCPTAIEKRSRSPLLHHERKDNKFLLTLYQKDTPLNVTTTAADLPLIFTYYDREKAVVINPKQVQIKPCSSDQYCSKSLYLKCLGANTSNKSYFFDKIDHQCKPFALDTRLPTHAWIGPCSCATTCMTTNISKTFPFSSEQELNEFQVPYQHEHDMYPLKVTGLKMKSNYTSSCASLRSNNSLAASPYRHVSFAHHLFYIPQLRLIYCGIPKSGMSEWLKFFRHVIGAQDYLSYSHGKQDLQYFKMKRLSPLKASQLLTDPTYTKAVFFRDPAERLLSAYLDKIMKERYSQWVFRYGDPNAPIDERYVLNFTEFVHLVTYANFSDATPTSSRKEEVDPRGLHRMTDPHWKPQLWTCGLEEIFPLWDFVGNFHHLAMHTKLLLSKLPGEPWAKWGATYDSEPSNKSEDLCHRIPREERPQTNLVGFNQNNAMLDSSYQHSTGASSLVEKYYTPELLQKVRKAYVMDYAVWDEMKDQPSHVAMRARDFQSIRKQCQL